jgi:hypothetical protein
MNQTNKEERKTAGTRFPRVDPAVANSHFDYRHRDRCVRLNDANPQYEVDVSSAVSFAGEFYPLPVNSNCRERVSRPLTQHGILAELVMAPKVSVLASV